MGKIAALPIVGMVLAECALAGLIIISNIAMFNGMSNLIFLCYSNALVALIFLPISLAFHKFNPSGFNLLGWVISFFALILRVLGRSERPPLTVSIIGWFFLLGLIGFMVQFLGYAGINYRSPTLSTAMLNLIPAFTFVLAVICSQTGSLEEFVSRPIGVLASSWLIVQASVLKKYRAELIMDFFYCSFVAIQSVVVSSNCRRDLSSWELTPKIRVFGSAFQVGVSTWCLRRTGPVFVAMFKPLGIVVAVFIGVTFLGDTFYLGSLIGAVVIVIGLYSVMWGKANEEKRGDDAGEGSLALSRQRIPLLQSHIEEI